MSFFFDAAHEVQRAFHDTVAGNMAALGEHQTWALVWAVSSVSFLYGFFHAIGPGHGKVIVATYLLADGGTLRRGLWITALSALMQACVAIALVLGLYHLLGLAREKTELAAAWFEAGSFALVGLLGLHMVWRGIMAYRHRGCGHDHCDHHHGDHTKSALAMIFSIGIRPCSGGILVMFFACLLDVIPVGIAATFVMAIGTGLATSLIALAASGSRAGILKMVDRSEGGVAVLSAAAKIIGGLLLVVMGVLFCMAALPQGQGLLRHDDMPAAHDIR